MSGYSNRFSVGGESPLGYVHSIVYPKVQIWKVYCSGKGNRERSGIIKHSLHNGVVLTMENRVLLFPLMLGGFVH